MKFLIISAWLASTASILSAPAQAQSIPTTNSAAPIAASPAPLAAGVSAQTLSRPTDRPLPEILTRDALADQRGGYAIVVSSQTLLSILQGNVINGDYSAGAVSLSDNALANFNGVGNLLINTGALNNLQSGMNITINMGQ